MKFEITAMANCSQPLSVVSVHEFERKLRDAQKRDAQQLERIQTELNTRRRIQMCVTCRGFGETAFDAAALALYSMAAVELDTLWSKNNQVRQLEVAVLGTIA